jgi:hypothetical protein
MAEFKNEIRLGVSLDSQGAQGKLEEIIKTLNSNKMNLDVNMKDSNVSKQLETLTNLAKNFKEALGGNISLGNIDKTINETVSTMSKLNGELLKTTEIKFNNGAISKQLTETADGIGTVVKQIKSFHARRVRCHTYRVGHARYLCFRPSAWEKYGWLRGCRAPC